MPDETSPLDVIGTAEAGQILGRSIATITRWVADGTLPLAGRLPGQTGAMLFHRADVERIARERAGEKDDAPAEPETAATA